MSKMMVHHNAACLKCGALEAEMVRTGCLIFCKKCIEEEFTTDDPPRQEREKYRKWLKVYQEKAEEEWEK